MIYIKESEISKLLDFHKIVELTKDGFKKYSNYLTLTPPYINFQIEKAKGHVHFKAGHILGDDYFTLKYSGGFWENEKLNIPVDNGLFIVFSAQTGVPLCIIDDVGFLTAYRTGIAGAIATKELARNNSKVVTVIGSGLQARMQITSLMQVMNIDVLKVWGRNKNNVLLYVSEMREKFPNLLVQCYDSIEDSLKDTDIIITTTYSDTPIIKSEWIKEGMHITAVGACGPNMQELDENILSNAIVVTDSKEMCSVNGELAHALKKGLIDISQVVELGQVIDNFNRKDTDITLADLVGLGFQDAIVGSFIYKKAREKDKNTMIE